MVMLLLSYQLMTYHVFWFASQIQTVNMLYIDSPVSSGFSYLHNDASVPANCDEISQDLLLTLTAFLHNNSDFQVNTIDTMQDLQ